MQAAQPADQDHGHPGSQACAAQRSAQYPGHQQRNDPGTQVAADDRPGLGQRAGGYGKQQHRRGSQRAYQVQGHLGAEHLGAHPDAEQCAQGHADGGTTPFGRAGIDGSG